MSCALLILEFQHVALHVHEAVALPALLNMQVCRRWGVDVVLMSFSVCHAALGHFLCAVLRMSCVRMHQKTIWVVCAVMF